MCDEWLSWLDLPRPKKKIARFTYFLQCYTMTFGEIKSRDKLKELYNRYITAIYDR